MNRGCEKGGKVKFMRQTTKVDDDTLVLETPKKNTTLIMDGFHQTRVDAVLEYLC